MIVPTDPSLYLDYTRQSDLVPGLTRVAKALVAFVDFKN